MEQLVHLRLKSIYKAFKQSSTEANMAASAQALSSSEWFDDEGPTEEAEALVMAAAAASALVPSVKQLEAKSRRVRSRTISEYKASVEEYERKVKRADDAAAALLAELEEEEQAEKSKKKKKKKKKDRQQSKKDEGIQIEPSATSSCNEASSHNEVTSDPQIENRTSRAQVASSISVDANESNVEVTPTKGMKSESVDPLEEKFRRLSEAEDTEGLDELLSSVKGVPGKAVLRKNIKKALKRIRTSLENTENVQLKDDGFIPVSEALVPPANDARAGTETPVESEYDPRVAELLKTISYTHNNTPNAGNRSKVPNPKGSSECILHMAPVIVGWVIGKGGQRIREMMEESGARIWIDQESMKPEEPRVVYVSGNRRNVDVAIKMIKDLISRAPAETPKSAQSTSALEANNTKPPKTGASGKVPGVPKDFAANSETFQLKPRDSLALCPTKTKHEITCDPRFVPLLIGRRGWTIKNIQDASGARIDIDQTVTPRKITISGSETSVEIAKGMVGDVLSYPQSQLHGTDDGDKEQFESLPSVNPGPDVTSSQALETEDLQLPPTSEILAGDNKDAVSATSSLSSTPEPNMVMKALNQSNADDMLLSSSGNGPYLPMNAPVGNFQPPRHVSKNPFEQDPPATSLASDVRKVPFGSIGSEPGPVYGAPVALYEPQPLASAASEISPLIPPRQLNSYNSSAFQTIGHGPVPGVQNPPPLVNPQIDGQGPVADNLLPGIWGRASVPDAGGSSEFGLAAAVDFLNNNQTSLPRKSQTTGGIGEPLRTSGLVHQSHIGTESMFRDAPMKDESNIVDSLFGPSGSKTENSELITGLDGLGIGASNNASSMWSQETREADIVDSIPGLSSLLSDPEPLSGFSDPDHSRFAWRSST